VEDKIAVLAAAYGICTIVIDTKSCDHVISEVIAIEQRKDAIRKLAAERSCTPPRFYGPCKI
jgi:hypothetical protein